MAGYCSNLVIEYHIFLYCGIYSIPLVYGNAIINGSTNAASYTKVSGTYSLDFVNGAGTIINTPFIEK